MTETHIGSAGATHTGSGPQNVHNHYHPPPDPLLRNARGKTPRAVAEDELRWLQKHFEDPEGYGDAYEVLEKQRVVLLDGRPGDGLHATGQVLLGRLPPHAPVVRELPWDREEDDGGSTDLLAPGLVDEDDRLLLDLSRASAEHWARIRKELSQFRQAVRTQDAALVVILPPSADAQLPPALADLRRRIVRAPGMEHDIVRLFLRQAGLDPAAADGMPPGLAAQLAPPLPLPRVARLAQIVCEAVRGGTPFTAAWPLALQFITQPKHAAKAFTTVRKGGQRALLVTTAMLHGAPAGAVHQATALLLGVTRTDGGRGADVRDLLGRRTLSERLEQVSASIDATGHVGFDSPDYDQALREHVWRSIPDLRLPLRIWVGSAVSLPELSSGDRDGLVGRFAQQCLPTGHGRYLIDLADEWTRHASPGTERLRAAAHALARGLGHEEFGGTVRRQILDWSRDAHLSPALRQVLIEVCTEVLALTDPESALVRLHHLARREGSRTEARNALVRLVEGDARLLRKLLFRCARYQDAADPDLFLAVSDPAALWRRPGRHAAPLLGQQDFREHLTACWAAVLRTRPTAQWAGPVHAWFRAVVNGPAHTEQLLDVLVAACDRRAGLLSRLYSSSRSWAAARPADDRAAALPARLYQKICAAQLSRPTSPRETTAP